MSRIKIKNVGVVAMIGSGLIALASAWHKIGQMHEEYEDLRKTAETQHRAIMLFATHSEPYLLDQIREHIDFEVLLNGPFKSEERKDS